MADLTFDEAIAVQDVDAARTADVSLEPVEIEWTRTCEFKAKPCGVCGKPRSNAVHRKPDKGGTCVFAKRLNCARCGRAKSDPDHFGAPASVNVYGSGNPMFYQALKQSMQALIAEALEQTDLPRPMESVLVECEITFPDRKDRDEGNMRGPLEKALGDALTEGGWLAGDTFYPVRRFTFGGITPRYEPGVLRTRIVLFPSLDEPPSVAVEPDSAAMTLALP